MPKLNLLILGAGGYGQALAEVAQSLDQWKNICFIDDRWPTLTYVNGYDVIGNIDSLATIDTRDLVAIAAVGKNRLRNNWHSILKQRNIPLATIIHSKAIISPSAKVASGVSIMAGCVVSASTQIHEGVILNIGTLLDHDVTIEAYAHLSVGVKVAGGKTVSAFSFLPIGESVSH